MLDRKTFDGPGSDRPIAPNRYLRRGWTGWRACPRTAARRSGKGTTAGRLAPQAQTARPPIRFWVGGRDHVARWPAVRLRIRIEVDLAVAQFDGIGVHGHHRRQGQRLAAAYVEAGAVARALDLGAIELALIERPLVVRADVVDRIDSAVHVAQRDRQAVDLDDTHFASRHL